MTTLRIFYAWQSDKLLKHHKYLVESAIKAAIATIKASGEVDFDVLLDRDTKGLPGTPAIAASIEEKIAACDLFIGDVTIITPHTAQKPTPNPNVLIELGYAAAKKGWDRVVCMMNDAHGNGDKLPFDLRHRRWPLVYTLADSALPEERKRQEKALAIHIEYAIRTALRSGILVRGINPKDRRLALRVKSSFSLFFHLLGEASIASGVTNSLEPFFKDYPDATSTGQPERTIVAPIMDVLSHIPFSEMSPIGFDGANTVSWTDAFLQCFKEIARECERMLTQFSERDEELVSAVETILDHTNMVSSMLQFTISPTMPQFRGFYDAGVPDVQREVWVTYLLDIVRAMRIARRFAPGY